MPRRKIEYMPVDDVKGAKRNPKGHADAEIDASFERFGFTEPTLLDERTGRLVAGHGRLARLRARHKSGGTPPDGVVVGRDGVWKIPVVRGWSSENDREAEAYLVASNRLTEVGGWNDPEQLAAILGDLGDTPDALDGTGYDPADLDALLADLAGDDPDVGSDPPPRPSLADRFLVPPFSVLDARQGYWSDRKREWLSIGIRSEEGRGDLLALKGQESPNAISRSSGGVTIDSWSGADPAFYAKKRAVEKRLGREITTAEFESDHYTPPEGSGGISTTGTSVFDPVLCEIAYRWFSPPDGSVLDPFAGGSVRGVVASILGRSYTGVDLSDPQVQANRAQGDEILSDTPLPEWISGDSRTVVPSLSESYDLLFSCPPYADLERYSDDPADLSVMGYEQFADAYREIIAASADRLAVDRFAVWVVGEVRAPDGRYRGLVPDTVEAFASAGLAFYNEMVLVTPSGSLPVRAGRQFASGRKIGKTHQNVLVFVKGDPAAATEACGQIEIDDPADLFGDLVSVE